MKKKFAVISTAVLLALGWVLGTGTSAQATVVTTHTVTAWLEPATAPSNIWPQSIVGSKVSDTLDAYNAANLPCGGATYQIDRYTTLVGGRDVTQEPWFKAGVLTYAGEDNQYGELVDWKYVTTPACPLPDAVFPEGSSTCDTYTIPTLEAYEKYPLDANGIRYIAGTHPLVGTVTIEAHTLASDTTHKQGSKVYSFTATPCPVVTTPTPTPTPPVVGNPNPPTGPKLAYTGVTIQPWEGFLGAGLLLAGIGAVMMRRRNTAVN